MCCRAMFYYRLSHSKNPYRFVVFNEIRAVDHKGRAEVDRKMHGPLKISDVLLQTCTYERQPVKAAPLFRGRALPLFSWPGLFWRLSQSPMVITLAQALQNNFTLEHLNLSDTRVSDEGAEWLASMLQQNHALRQREAYPICVWSFAEVIYSYSASLIQSSSLKIKGRGGPKSRKRQFLRSVCLAGTSLAHVGCLGYLEPAKSHIKLIQKQPSHTKNINEKRQHKTTAAQTHAHSRTLMNL